MIQFEGDRDFALSPAALGEKLGDARFLVKCIPDVVSVARAEPSEAVCTIRPGFSFVRGTLELTLRVVEVGAGKPIKLLLLSKGMGNSSTVEALLTLAARETGTHVHWLAQVKELSGLLKPLQGLVRAAAPKVVADTWTRVEAQLKQ